MFQGSTINKQAFSDQDIEIYKKALLKPGALRSALCYYQAALQNKEPPLKTIIQTPTLLIWAEEDKVLGKELTFDMEPLFNDCLKVEYISKCSHWVMEEAPEKVNALLIRHFKNEFL